MDNKSKDITDEEDILIVTILAACDVDASAEIEKNIESDKIKLQEFIDTREKLKVMKNYFNNNPVMINYWKSQVIDRNITHKPERIKEFAFALSVIDAEGIILTNHGPVSTKQGPIIKKKNIIEHKTFANEQLDELYNHMQELDEGGVYEIHLNSSSYSALVAELNCLEEMLQRKIPSQKQFIESKISSVKKYIEKINYGEMYPNV